MQRTLAGVAHRFVVGAAYDCGNTGFTQSWQPATFAADRNTIGTGDFELETDVSTRNRSAGLYVADTMALGPAMDPAARRPL